MAGDIILSNEELIWKRVQELAITVDKPPARFIIGRDGDKEELAADTFPELSKIPIIDLQLLFRWLSSGSATKEEEKEMEKFRSALCEWGCFQAIGHGISSSILDDLCEFTRGFFELPMEEKQKYSKAVGGFQGYGSDAIISEEQVLDWTDRLYLIVYPEDKKEPQFWPEKPNSLKEVLDEYTEKTKLVLELLLKAMAKSLNLDEDCFLNQFGERAALEARFNYYPHCSRPDLVFGVKPHSDVSALTTILQDKVEGLQVLKDGQWSTVPIVPRAILIFIGDQIEIMSNGIFKGVVHRVVTNIERARLSLAVFHMPEQEKEIEPFNGLIDDKKPKLYKKVKNYSDIQFTNFLLGKTTIDSAKV